MNAVSRYAEQILEGKLPACLYVKQACKRHFDDIRAGAWEFDEKKAERPVQFIELLRHWKAPFAGNRFLLEPWQKFIVGSIFGWIHPDTGLRRYRTALVLIPRKNGKTTLAGGIGAYMLVADGEQGAEVYSTATKLPQAKIVWKDLKNLTNTSKALRDRLIHRFTHTEDPVSNSVFEPLAADSDKLDGLNPSCAINDELHAWKSRDLYDVIEDGMGSRANPLNFTITTNGVIREGIFDSLVEHAENVLGNPGYNDETFFAYLSTVDEADKENWMDPAVWAKANPNLGVSKHVDYMQDQANKAAKMPDKLNAFLTKQLNIKRFGSTAWLSLDDYDLCCGEIDKAILRGNRCYAGLDLSSKIDVTALVLAFPPGCGYDEYTLLPRFYIPEKKMRERIKKDRVPYDVWREQGLVTMTPGDVVDMAFVRRDINHLAEVYALQEIALDPWRGVELMTALMGDGFECLQFSQGKAAMCPATEDFEEFVLSRRIRHGGNPVLRWMFGNTSIKTDENGNKKPEKTSTNARIDGAIASIMAVARAASAEKGASVYETRGVRTLD